MQQATLLQNPHLPISQQLSQILDQISSYFTPHLNFMPELVSLSEDEDLLTIFIRSQKNRSRTFYLGHGFGGTSLMYLPIFEDLLERGNIVLWELRGMGISDKQKQYQTNLNADSSIQFFVEGLSCVIKHFNHPKIVLMCHSFSGYICLRYLLEADYLDSVERVILLSPIGITPGHADYKNKIRSFGDFKNLCLSKLGWRFNLTYKSPLRTICCCFRAYLLRRGFQAFPLSQLLRQMLVKIFSLMVDLPDGSDSLFFSCFLARVIPFPGRSIEQLIENGTNKFAYKTELYFGGNQDWVDKKGANYLSEKLENVEIHNLDGLGHMILFYPEAMRQLLTDLTNQ